MPYSLDDARVQMTLSAIAYAADTGNPKGVKPAIEQELQGDHTHDGKPYSYATAKDWTLAWGPVLAPELDNLMFVARNAGTGALSLVLRGTIGKLRSFFEDLPLGQVATKYVPAEARATVSGHFEEGLDTLLACSDSGQTLAQFLAAEATAGTTRQVFVTGHSQGGGLTPMLLAWLQSSRTAWPGADGWQLAGYAFAPPTSGNPGFADWIAGECGGTAPTYLVINPLDVVPCGYAWIRKVRDDGIPEAVPWDYKLVIDAALLWADKTGPWAQPARHREFLRAIPLPGSMGYFEQVEGQHNHNSYLKLLGAPQVYDIGSASPLPDA